MRRRLIIAAILAATAAIGIGPALASTAQSVVVSDKPVSFTPNVMQGTVYAIIVVGSTVVVGGDFTTVQNAAGTTTYQRHNLFAYGLTTGVLTSLSATFDGDVNALAGGPNNTVYVGGAFHTVNGVAERGLTQISLTTGARVPAFTGYLGDGETRTLQYAAGKLYVGGNFASVDKTPRVALARLNATTGALDPTLNLNLTSPTAGRTKVEDTALTADGKTLIAIGAIQHAGGQARSQLVMVNLAGTTATVANWYTNFYNVNCYAAFDTYVRQVDFSPKGDYFVVVTTGRLAGSNLPCDTAARFNTAGTGLHNPVWTNHTGGNTMLSVAVTGSAVYVGGHMQWLDNPNGNKKAGPGAVARPGIGAIDPTTGKALSWDPTSDRGVGVDVLYATANGLIVGSDTTQIGHQYHGRLSMFPLS
jgi:hypothetical protein